MTRADRVATLRDKCVADGAIDVHVDVRGPYAGADGRRLRDAFVVHVCVLFQPWPSYPQHVYQLRAEFGARRLHGARSAARDVVRAMPSSVSVSVHGYYDIGAVAPSTVATWRHGKKGI